MAAVSDVVVKVRVDVSEMVAAFEAVRLAIRRLDAAYRQPIPWHAHSWYATTRREAER